MRRVERSEREGEEGKEGEKAGREGERKASESQAPFWKEGSGAEAQRRWRQNQGGAGRVSQLTQLEAPCPSWVGRWAPGEARFCQDSDRGRGGARPLVTTDPGKRSQQPSVPILEFSVTQRWAVTCPRSHRRQE